MRLPLTKLLKYRPNVPKLNQCIIVFRQIQTSPKMTKNGLKEVLREYFGVTPLRVNSLRMDGKVKRFRGRVGVRNDFKKFYVKLPDGVSLASQEA